MKRAARLFLLLLCCVALSAGVASAHSGRTDSSGGHYNRSTGEYHYHHGRSAHQHPGGVCPYAAPRYTPPPEQIATPAPVRGSVAAATPSEPKKSAIPDLFGIALPLSPLIIVAASHYKDLYKERKREREFVNLYSGASIGDFVNIPRGVFIGADGLPTTDKTQRTWGAYTVYLSKPVIDYRGKYHTAKCRYGRFMVHAYNVRHMQPCGSCRPPIFDFSWYEEYKRITALQKKYNFPMKKADLQLPEAQNKPRT